MKKYKLLKDLPHCKAGEEFTLEENGNLYGIDGGIVYNYITLEKFDILNNTEWFEEIPEKTKNVFDLGIGDEYFFLNGSGIHRGVERKEIKNSYDLSFYMDAIFYGNVFSTEEEARKEIKKIIAIQKIKKYCWENDIDTEYESGKNDSSFYRRIGGDIISIEYFKNGNPLGYFSHDNAQKILDNFREELKIILN